MPRPRRYHGPVRIFAYFIGGPWDGCYTDDAGGMIDRQDGTIRMPPPCPEDAQTESGGVDTADYYHVYKPTNQVGRFVHDGWARVETQQ